MEIMQNMNLTNQDTNFLQAYLNHLSEEQRKAFVATYMYILNVGNGDAQFESQIFESQNFELILEAEELSMYNLDEGLIGSIMNFLKGKSAITKYYKGLDGAAKNYVSGAKKIDKMDKDKRAQFRKSELDKYEKTVKSLDGIKSKIDELKKDSKILQKMDSYANNKYKIKMFLTGRKANVSLSKMKGYEEDIEKIKADQTTLEDDIKKANAEAEELKKKKEEEEKAKADNQPSETEETTDVPESSDATKKATEKVKELKVAPENETPEQKTAREEKLKAAETAEKEAIEKDKADAKKKKEDEEASNQNDETEETGTEEKGATAGTGTETEEKTDTPEETKAEKIETDTETVKAETEKTQAETEKIKADADKANAEAEIKDKKNEKIKKQIDGLTTKKNNLRKDSIKNPEKKEGFKKGIVNIDSKIVKLEKQLKENNTLPLSFFYDLQSLNEEIKCLENLIGERL